MSFSRPFFGGDSKLPRHTCQHMKYSKPIKTAHLYPCPTCLPGAHRLCGNISLGGRRSPISEIQSKSHQWIAIEESCWHPRARCLHRGHPATLGTSSRNSLWAFSGYIYTWTTRLIILSYLIVNGSTDLLILLFLGGDSVANRSQRAWSRPLPHPLTVAP